MHFFAHFRVLPFLNYTLQNYVIDLYQWRLLSTVKLKECELWEIDMALEVMTKQQLQCYIIYHTLQCYTKLQCPDIFRRSLPVYLGFLPYHQPFINVHIKGQIAYFNDCPFIA